MGQYMLWSQQYPTWAIRGDLSKHGIWRLHVFLFCINIKSFETQEDITVR